MKKKAFVLILPIFFLLFLCEGRTEALSQQSPPPEKKPEPLSEWSKQWLEEVVVYIITAAEKDVFLSLPTERERGEFIEGFWRKRDPDPKTPENEFKNEYYRRIALANKFFGTSGIEGWRTDRGKIFILLGPPDEIQRDFTPSGSAYYGFRGPRETWNYWGLPNPRLPYNMEFVFIDRMETGHYVLNRGLQFTEGGSSSLDINSLHLQFDYLEYLTEAMKNPFEALDDLKGIITTQVTYDHIPFSAHLYTFKGKTGEAYLPLIMEIPYSGVTPKNMGETLQISLNLLVNVSNRLGQVVSERSKDVELTCIPREYQARRESMIQVQVPLHLGPDDYKIHLLVLDNVSGKIGTLHQDLSVAPFHAERLILSDVILTSGIEMGSPKSLSPEEGPDLKVAHSFRAGDEMTVFFEVYNLGLDSVTGRNEFEVEIQFLQDGKLVAGAPFPPGEATEERDCRVQTSMRLKNFQPGEYMLRVKVKDSITEREATRETRFLVIE